MLEAIAALSEEIYIATKDLVPADLCSAFVVRREYHDAYRQGIIPSEDFQLRGEEAARDISAWLKEHCGLDYRVDQL
jgi:hypothetical protein